MNTEEILPGLIKIVLPIARGGFESFINGWLIKDSERRKTILIETGPASAVPGLLSDIAALGVKDIDYLLYTHVHLDHSGGAGQFCDAFPNVKIIAPNSGVSHLIDPSILFAASRKTLGALCDAYGTPKNVPEDMFVSSMCDKEALEIIETPGHAPHHSSYIYNLNGKRILFAGEAGGCCTELADGDIFMRPATPHKFYCATALSSLDKLLSLNDIYMICYPHSGSYPNAHELLTLAKDQMILWRDIVKSLPCGFNFDDAREAIFRGDPMMKKLESLPDDVRSRELFFIGQSIKGYMGAAERNVL